MRWPSTSLFARSTTSVCAPASGPPPCDRTLPARIGCHHVLIEQQMLKVKENGEIWFAIFTFAGSSGIDDTMLALARGGVRIRGVLDSGQANHGWAAPQWLRHPNIELRVPKSRVTLRTCASSTTS
jgi:hypothetical protein